jgi:hypothetical protein
MEQDSEMKQEFILRTQSNHANSYGVGEVVSPGVVLFRAGTYDLSRSEAEAILASKRKASK